MPAINVAKTDTFEIQRQKINQIGDQIFNISQGGSDLATGNLKLGDGTRIAPSLSFTSDNSLGIYKPDENTFGFVSSGKKVADFSPSALYSFKDLIIQQNVLNSSGISILNKGSNYDPGTYNDIVLTGGTGDGATADITVTSFGGEVTNVGSNYNEGSYSNIPLIGGTGNGATASFEVEGVEGFISDAGSGYIPGTYTNVDLTDGSGVGATADITITGEINLVGSITAAGSGYTEGTYSFVQLLNKPIQTFVVTTTSNPGTPPPNNVYVIDGDTQKELTLIKGNTYRFDLSDSSNSGHPLIFQTTSGQFLDLQNYQVVQKGIPGELGAFVDLIIKPSAPTETIKYNCQVHDGMGANISITTGTVGFYGTDAFANITVNSSGVISNVEFTSSGFDYKENDIIQVFSVDVGGTGSGFEYTLSAPIYTGEVTSVTIQNNGVDYSKDDVLSASASDLGGVGSGFDFTIDNDPNIVSNLSFTSKGTGYDVDDVLELPKTVSDVEIELKGQVFGVSTTLSDSSAVITVDDTTGILVGMTVSGSFGDTGFLDTGTTVLSVDSSTQITLSKIPTASGEATLTFSSEGSVTEITVLSVEGILIGSLINQTAGTGILAPNTTVSSINTETNTIILSQQPQQAGTATLDFVPPFGDPTDNFEYEINNLGEIETFSISAGGNGYSLLDTLSVNSSDLTQPITYPVINKQVLEVSFVGSISTSAFSVGDFLKRKDGEVISVTQISAPALTPTVIDNISTTLSDSSPVITVSDTTGITEGMLVSQDFQNDTGFLNTGTTVLSVDSSTQLTLSQTPFTSGNATLTFTSDESGTYTNVASTTSGDGSGATFDIERDLFGSITSITVNFSGYFYSNEDTIIISGEDVGGSTPDNDIELEVFLSSSYQDLEIYKINTSGGNISSILIDFDIIDSGNLLIKSETTTPEYEVNTVSDLRYRYFINTGSGFELTPSFTLFAGNTYDFDLSDSSNSGHIFSFSTYRDGIWGPSLIENIVTTLVTTSNQIVVDDSTGILPGMAVTVFTGTGSLVTGTTVEAVVGNTITLSSAPLTSGAVTLTFRGVEYTDGVTRSDTLLSIKVTEDIPNLYYYCATQNDSHVDEGGEDNKEALITIDLNNPKVFGSNFSVSVAELQTSDVINGDIETGDFTAVKFIGQEAELGQASVTGTLTAPEITGNTITATSITSSDNLGLVGTAVNITGNFNVGSNVQVVSSNGNITTSGILKSTNSLNINDKLNIIDNIISSSFGNNILLSPPTGRVTKVDATTALIIPSGTSAQRPTGGVVENGSIRFNTDTNQYEGYSDTNQSWSSLGGVRDLDGNTTILAEEAVGANDNILWFVNDNVNTIRFTPQYQEFVNVKKLRSVNTSAPDYENWTANTPVTTGDYLKYRNNIYEVTADGVTGTSGTEPTDTTGNPFTNGTATLQYFTTAVAPLTFEEISELRVDPLGFTDLVVNGELRFSNNVISTDINDLLIRPNASRKVTVDSNTSLVIPVGDNNSRGNAARGSIRFNTSILQYEGYDGTNWSSLGGVRDVDGNTYIIPELSPGSNENTLFFYNNNENTLRVTTSQIELDTIDTFASVTSDAINFNAATLTFDSLATTLDNTSSTETFLFSTKDNFDFGLSVGLTTDPLVRLTTDGEIFYNSGFGTGVYDGLRLLDGDLKQFELSDVKLVTFKTTLDKGTINQGAAILYNPSIHESAKVQIIAHNTTTGDKEFIEYSVVDNGIDIFYTDFGNIKTGEELISTLFDFNSSNEVRVTFIANTNLTNGDQIVVTVVSNIIKR